MGIVFSYVYKDENGNGKEDDNFKSIINIIKYLIIVWCRIVYRIILVLYYFCFFFLNLFWICLVIVGFKERFLIKGIVICFVLLLIFSKKNFNDFKKIVFFNIKFFIKRRWILFKNGKDFLVFLIIKIK